MPKATRLISRGSRLESRSPGCSCCRHTGSLGFLLDYFMTFPSLALAALWHSARTQETGLMFVLCVYQNHLQSLSESDSWPPPWSFFSLGHREAPDFDNLARLVSESMQVESTAHILKTLHWMPTKDFPSSSWNRRAIYFTRGKGRRDVNGDHSK